ncbi:MAG: P-type Mg2+ transporter [Pseudonocardiales bacterium]|jgi:Mg2+-importing ATPase|nr:P-type Mg2+ transporter [Pseudonocardiales bacterium]
MTVLRRMEGSPRGLTEAEASERLARVGENRPMESVVPGAAARLRAALLNPFVLLLAGVGVVFAVVGDARGTITLTLMITIGVGLRWWQQVRSDQALRTLRSRVITTATVRRRARPGHRGVEREVLVDDLVPGDLVMLGPGDAVPADVRLLTARDLRVDQSVVSGESLAVGKQAPTGEVALTRPALRRRRSRSHVEVVDLPSVCFAGTAVVSGSGTGVVIGTGPGTYVGALAAGALSARPRSSVDQGVRAVGWTLIRFMLVLVPIVLVINGVVRGDWAQAGLFAVAVAVGLTPEMLPVIATATLARGAVQLAGRQVVVKRLDAIQDLGGMDVLCLDKTGTLTEDRVVFTHSIDLDGRPDGASAQYAFLAAHFQTSPPDRFDEAVTDEAAQDDALLTDALFTRVDEIGFDHHRRCATVVVRRGPDDHLLVTRGDPDEVLARCTRVQRGAEQAELTAMVRHHALDVVAAHHAHGMRIVAVAIKDGPARRRPYGPEDETGMTLVGFVGFVDPVKESTAAAITQLQHHRVAVRVLTGDSPRVVARVCEQVGIEAGQIVLGSQVERADEVALRVLVETNTVFAKVNPQHKARIAAALQAGGHCVGFLGDGVNDAIALRTADVGIAVHTAAAAARDAADLILLDADLGVLARGVVEGRRALGNTTKYVRITASSNLGNVLSVLAASALLPFLPMLPIQLMVQNLLYDAAQLALPWDRVEPDYLRRPRRWDAAGMVRFMLLFGPLSSVFDLCTFATLWWVFGINDPAQQGVFQAAWFIEGLLSQVLVVLVLRSRRATVAAAPVLGAAAAVVLTGVVVALSALAPVLQMGALPLGVLPWLLAIVAIYLFIAYLAKLAVTRRGRAWL